jgi:LacI family transcriptional regulator
MGKLSAKRILDHSINNLGDNVSEITILNTDIVIRESSNRCKV